MAGSVIRSLQQILMDATLRMKMSIICCVALLFVVFSSVAAEGKTIRIDTHTHMIPPFYYDILKEKGLTAGGREIPEWTVKNHLGVMDSLNIETAILSVSTPGAKLSGDTVEQSRELARRLNEYGHMLAETYPGRFQFFATLTLPDVEGSVAEAIYALDELKAAGVVLPANSQGQYLGSKKFDSLMEVLNSRGATVFVHPGSISLAPVSNDMGGETDHEVLEILPTFIIDFLLDTTRAAMNLVNMKVTKRYPNIKIILSHSGGFLPFAAYRIHGALAMLKGEDPADIQAELQKFYVDTALSSSPSAFPSTLAYFPHDQILYGTDWPFAPTFAAKTVTKNLDDFPLNDEERHHINFHCADQLFEKPLKHWRNVWHKNGADKLQ